MKESRFRVIWDGRVGNGGGEELQKIRRKLGRIMDTCVDYGEGSGTPLQHSCLENPMDGGDWWAAVHGVANSWT